MFHHRYTGQAYLLQLPVQMVAVWASLCMFNWVTSWLSIQRGTHAQASFRNCSTVKFCEGSREGTWHTYINKCSLSSFIYLIVQLEAGTVTRAVSAQWFLSLAGPSFTLHLEVAQPAVSSSRCGSMRRSIIIMKSY